MKTIVDNNSTKDITDSGFLYLNAHKHLKDNQVLELDPDVLSSINYSTFEELNDFSNISIKNKKVHEALKVDKVNFWFYWKFRLYFDLRNLNYKIEKINKSSNNEPVILLTSSLVLKKYYNQHKQVEVRDFKKKQKTKKIAFSYLLFFGLRLIFSFFQIKFKKIKPSCFLELPQHDQPVLFPDGKTIKSNYVTGYLSRSHSNKTILNDITPPKKGQSFSSKNFKLIFNIPKDHLFTEWIYIKGWLKHKASINNGKESIRKTLIQLQKTPANPIIISLLKSYTPSIKLILIRYFGFLVFSKTKSIKSLISYSEYSPNQKAVFDAFYANKKETIAIQHGAIHNLHPGYIYTKAEQQENIFPSKLLIWGQYWKDLLSETNYPIATTKIIGQLRSDVIPYLSEKIKKENIIVFATQPQRDENIRKKVLTDVIEASSKLKKTTLIIKPHPIEKDDNYFLEIGATLGISVIIDRSTDLYELIAKSTALITCFSTVGIETVYFKKPLIVLDYLNQDLQGFIKNKIGIPVYNKSELISTLLNVENNDSGILEEDQDLYIGYLSNKIDGKVVERALSEIN
ncbi:MAG: hypothetical protein ACI9U0_001595 [Flavobacteriales bacterium]|jgi:hypothetical protein|tara:strand:+ start:4955 stop:6667 length:1713 start_codon:yes stop_codon:yes gene_type:complete